MKKPIIAALAIAALAGCASRPPAPTYKQFSSSAEAEYEPYLVDGNSEIVGQAFLAQKGGGTVKAAGRLVTIDPVTEVSRAWWYQAGKVWRYKSTVPPFPKFVSARRSTTADADGRFKFSNIPAGSYYIRTEITWDVPFHGAQGGLVTGIVEVKAGESKQAIVNGAN
ncbi:lipoprotein [Duganella zoogloeoides]|uniref:Type IV secretion system putative lipoprotein virB7 n=1 Tax=Duganella zoogloeoides TaxID=75659 RepID=A0ABZ0Y4M1_9BURK|nr:carboxypeptidase-like regulatory domain-containing protein [Duganella zoogloeoides]WQH06846.1 lipoprotein [Duganella zoogloeoides]